MKTFAERLIEKRPRRKPQPKERCECGRVAKWIDGDKLICDQCRGDRKVTL